MAPLTFKILISLAIVVIATVHGWLAAWLAIWMLFHPHRRVKALGITIWPQGMIPRHREKLAQSVGNAVGNELVSQDTVFDALFETRFFSRNVESFITSYTNDLLSTVYPPLMEALPPGARGPVLEMIAALRERLAEHIASTLKSEETAEAIGRFVDRQIDQLLERRLSDTIGGETVQQILAFANERFRHLVEDQGLASQVRAFVSERLDALAHSQATLAEAFTPETVAIIKDRVDQQVPPIVHQLAEIATSKKTRQRLGALIKREVDEYYQQLSLVKKVFISRRRIHNEIDDLVNETLPRRVEEYLRGPAFAEEATGFLNSTIDHLMARPLNELVGQIAPDKFEMIKNQVAERFLALARSPELATAFSGYLAEAVERLRPQTLGAVLETVNPDSAPRAKSLLTKSLMSVIAREETPDTINAILSAQIERLLAAPVGRLSDYLPDDAVKKAGAALAEQITAAARERLPAAIAEFDVGGLVHRKVSDYPIEKLEALVLSVAARHLKTIELFGAIIGLWIGVGQAIYFWLSYVPKR